MPCDAARSLCEQLLDLGITGTSMYQMNFRMSLRTSTDGHDMKSSEVSAKGNGLVDGYIGEILVSKSEHFAVSGEECELIFSCGSQATELDAANCRTNSGS